MTDGCESMVSSGLRSSLECGPSWVLLWTAEAVGGPEGPLPTGAHMSLPRTVAEVLSRHVVFELESIDRMYLNLYVPDLQWELGVVSFFRFHRGHSFASGALMSPMSKGFVARIEELVKRDSVPLVTFERGQRKEDVAKEHLARFRQEEGVFLIGKAQEKARVFRTERRYDEKGPYPWIVRSTAMVNHFYFYCLDADFGPFFLKFGTYFPYNGKLCLNGHEYLKQQLHNQGIAFEALDNGILSCENVEAAQAICDGLSAEKIEALARKWLRRLPHPFTRKDRQAGYRYDLSILQAEFSLTQVLDRPASGRVFFEEVIRENLDLGRPDQVQLIFNRRVNRRTPGRFRTRVITDGVTPSLHVDYKHSRIKQYHKEGRGLRTEATINDTRDFGIGRRLKNLPLLREVGFQANRRLLDVQRLSHDCVIAESAFNRLHQPIHIQGQRVSALRFADPRVHTLLAALPTFRLHADGFSNRDLREKLAALSGVRPEEITPGRMSYELRRLRLRRFIRRIPRTHRYEITHLGLRTALFFTRVRARLFRPAMTTLLPDTHPADHRLQAAFVHVERAIDDWCVREKLAS